MIFPDYTEVKIPANIAPLHFGLSASLKNSEAYAYFGTNTESIKVEAKNKQFSISASDWKKLMEEAKGGTVQVKVVVKENGKWIAYKPFNLYIAIEPVDPYIAYRLIEPGYETWGEMGIYQRCLENYKQTSVATNKTTNNNCMNCHSFCMQSPDKWLFHMRKDFGGTFLIDGDKIEKLNTKTPQTISSLVYPSWHPSGKFVAFSVNKTKQMFYSTDHNRIEVFDNASDVVVYDVDKHEIFTSPLLSSKSAFETFPTFSPDGKTLYYCSADSVSMPGEYEKAKYSLCAISFDMETKQFGNKVDTLYNARKNGKSVSFPRVSPDGHYLMFTLFDYGNFSIWHSEADLYLLDLSNNNITSLDVLNSDETESYHSWSSNSRWVVFSSRRIDGLYTRPFIAYIDENGKASKPFLLPQDNINYYMRLMKSFNIPEFVKGKIKVNPYQISQKARNDKGIDVLFK
ncbi:MAG: PD40 domain-containing protein [Peptostreptococcaceae bacterium]|nr:PD40 domain-containing protein [Peptostreptococcaceae bacterium]